MDPMTAMSAASAFGSAGQSNVNALSQGITSAFNIHESRQNRRFMRNMANTEMQRRVRDLRAAGLNPLMAVGGHGLGGASVPHSAAGTADAPQMDSMDKFQSVLAARLNEAQVNDLNSAAQLKNTQAGDISFMQKERLLNLLAQTKASAAQSGLTDAQREQLKIQAEMIVQQIKKLSVDTATSALQLEKEKLKKLPYQMANEQLEELRKKGILERLGFKNPKEGLRSILQRFQDKKRKKIKQRGASGNY